ncbi:unnamed protein product [Cyprideis torosa]|uniref:Uncharacterized protein n=1 Tax=Cyprideis torosa TaxID=163714 RepID=A0A7R8ZT54_9CRUS|nr:unnamed protein product [Cyprideis torosa]CAG0897401.1 unnamed protein product [Cyprideis torosa]
MEPESQKEPSALESQSLVEASHFTKLEDTEVTCDPNDFPGSTDAMPLQDVIPGSMDSNNQTCGVPDQIEVREDDGRVKKRKNSPGHCRQKKLFICAVCGKSLSSKQSLQFHELTHTGEKPFDCRICGKSFTTKSSLTKHKLIHTGLKRFACRICEKSYTTSSSLFTHKFTHTGEKPFACRICGKSFARKSTLTVFDRVEQSPFPTFIE